MDYSPFYNPNNNSSSSSTPILIPSSHSRRVTTTKNGKKKCNNNNTNNKAVGVRLSTDPQSIAARERRNRISDRFKMLQSLVPGGAKLDTVSMLDQAIQYVKFLKAQILLHEAIIKNSNNINYNTNDQEQYDHSYINYNSSSTSTTVNDAYYYDQDYYAVMYDCNNNNLSQQEGCGAGGCDRDGGCCNPQEISMAVTTSLQAAQITDVWGNYQGYDELSMYAL